MSIIHEVEEKIQKARHRSMLTMQDISNWQGPKAPEKVAKHEVLAIKATEGNFFDDPDFPTNWEFAKENEKARVAYHYFHPSIPGLSQAQYFLSRVNSVGIQNGDMFAVDLEETDSVEPEQADAQAKEFIEYIKMHTKAEPIVYTNLFYPQAGNCESLGEQPLWIADPSNPPGKPDVPHPWTDWLMNQYGVVRGIDADMVNATTVDALAKYGALVVTPKPPTIVTVTLSDGTASTEKEYHQDQQMGTLRGVELTAGTASLKFE